MDLCGTGGDAAGTVNVSTAAALVAASCGAKLAKHGNRAASSRAGSTDVLQALGIAVARTPHAAEDQFGAYGITFLSAPDFHPALVALAPLRQRLGRRTIFNLLGPLLNPAGVTRQLVGVYAPQLLAPFAAALRRLGSERAWIVHGDGLDELTVTGASDVALLDGSRQRIDPATLGLRLWAKDDLRGGDAGENAALLQAMLQGAPGAYRDIVILNAGAALVVAGLADTLQRGVDEARHGIDSGAALDLLRRLRHQAA